MAKSFRNLRGSMSPESKLKSRSIFKGLLNSLPLAAIRKSRGVTQRAVAQELGVSQVAISRLESRSDFLVSTLDKYASATGGVLSIVLKYSEESFCLEWDQPELGYRLVHSSDKNPERAWGNVFTTPSRARVKHQDLLSIVGCGNYIPDQEAA